MWLFGPVKHIEWDPKQCPGLALSRKGVGGGSEILLLAGSFGLRKGIFIHFPLQLLLFWANIGAEESCHIPVRIFIVCPKSGMKESEGVLVQESTLKALEDSEGAGYQRGHCLTYSI